jgi:iron complex transport system ATP-binding protein
VERPIQIDAAGGRPAIFAAVGVSFRHPGAASFLFQDLSLRVAPGESIGILGPNGSGKTSLLKLLGGILAQDGGEVLFEGRPVRSLRARERARGIALVPQESRLLFNFSLLEVVLMGRSPHLGPWGLERPEDFEAARAALRDMDLAGQEDRGVQELSSGERQRALIARALAQEPRVIMLDEPTAFLDLKHRLQIHEILRRLNGDRGLTVIGVSHDLNLAARYASRLIVLHRGRVAADGPPGEVLTPALIREVYETEAIVDRDPATGGPLVIPRAPLVGRDAVFDKPEGVQ